MPKWQRPRSFSVRRRPPNRQPHPADTVRGNGKMPFLRTYKAHARLGPPFSIIQPDRKKRTNLPRDRSVQVCYPRSLVPNATYLTQQTSLGKLLTLTDSLAEQSKTPRSQIKQSVSKARAWLRNWIESGTNILRLLVLSLLVPAFVWAGQSTRPTYNSRRFLNGRERESGNYAMISSNREALSRRMQPELVWLSAWTLPACERQ